MIVLSEDSPRLTPSASARSLKSVTEAARIAGCEIRYIPQQEICSSAQDCLAHLSARSVETPGVWIGYVPAAEWYRAIYDEALSKRIRLLNTPEEHLNAQEFDRAYSYLRELTPESRILTDITQCEQAIEQLGLPVFVKGAVQSRKAKGWKACVAETPEELMGLVRQLFALDVRSRGRVVVRRFVPMRHIRVSGVGFPFGREYRVFLYRERILGWGYYWEGEDPLKAISPEEKVIILGLASEAAHRVNTPFIAVDIGQTARGDWIVIETGDAQFSGVSQTPLFQLWHEIRNVTVTRQELPIMVT